MAERGSGPTGALLYAGPQIGALFLIGILSVAVLWEANHLVEWAQTMCQQYGNGTLSSYLRHHAYSYVTWFFGTDFGWTVGQ